MKIIGINKYVQNKRLLTSLCPNDMYRNVYFHKRYRTTYVKSRNSAAAISHKNKLQILTCHELGNNLYKLYSKFTAHLNIQPDIVRRRNK